MVFPVVMYGCDNWTIKKSQQRRIDAFGLWCWRRLLRVPWTSWRSNQSTLKEINTECSLEGLMLKLKFQFFDHLVRRADSLAKTLVLGKIEGGRRGWQRMRCLDMILSKLQKIMKVREAWHAVVCSKSLSCIWPFVTSWTVACQAPLCMGFSRQEYWNGLPCPSPGHLRDPGIKPTSLASNPRIEEPGRLQSMGVTKGQRRVRWLGIHTNEISFSLFPSLFSCFA